MGEKADSELVRRQNRRIVLTALRRHASMARIELGRETGLSPASITAIVAQLIADNLVLELDDRVSFVPHAKRGRPMVRLALNPEATNVLAVKISADEVLMVLADFAGAEIGRRALAVPTFTSEQAEFGKRTAREIETFLAATGKETRAVARIGIAVQGYADSRKGTISWSPVFRARNIPIVREIEDRLGVPCMIGNDANMMAEGLAANDPERYGGVTAVIFTGYGVGMGLIIDGRVFHGATGAASELGHMNHIPNGDLCRCGQRGCLEAYAADYAILRKAEGLDETALASVPSTKMAELLTRAGQADKAVLSAFGAAGEALGFGIARLIAILNPDRIVIAGPGEMASTYIEPAMRQAIRDGVVTELRSDVAIEYTSFTSDMITSGTIAALLRDVDQRFARGTGVETPIFA